MGEIEKQSGKERENQCRGLVHSSSNMYPVLMFIGVKFASAWHEYINKAVWCVRCEEVLGGGGWIP